HGALLPGGRRPAFHARRGRPLPRPLPSRGRRAAPASRPVHRHRPGTRRGSDRRPRGRGCGRVRRAAARRAAANRGARPRAARPPRARPGAAGCLRSDPRGRAKVMDGRDPRPPADMTGSIPDLARVRAFLRRWCDTEVAVDLLEVSHLTVGPDGPRRALYEGPGPGGQVLRLVAQRVEPAEGRRLEAELNRDYRRSGAPPAAGFVQPAIYAPELHLLLQAFPADGRLGALGQAADGSAMVAVLEAALAARTGGARLAGVAVHVVR